MDWIGILVIVLVGAVHLPLGRRALGRGLETYVVADRRQRAGTVALSLLATILGASAVMGTAGLAAAHGWSALVWLWAGAGGLFVLALLIGRVEIGTALTLPQLVAQKGGRVAQLATGAVIVPAWLGILAAQLIALKSVVNHAAPGFGWYGALGAALLVTAYVVRGGQQRVLLTDRIQLLVLTGLLVALGLRLVSVAPWESLAGEAGAFTPLPFPRMVDIALAVGVPFLIGPDMISRLLTLPGARERRHALLMASGGLLAIGFLIALVGVGAVALGGAGKGDTLIPELSRALFGPVGVWVALVALSMALLSSMDTCLMSAASILALDLGRKTRDLSIALSAVVVMALALGVAFWLDGIIAALLFAYTLYTSGLGLPVALSLFTRLKLNPLAWVVAVSLGGTVGMAGHLAGFSYRLPLAIGAAGLGLAGVWFATRGRSREA